MRFRLSIRVTLLAIALIAGVLAAIIHYNDPAVRYRRDHDSASLRFVLGHRVANGDSIASVRSALGVGTLDGSLRLRRFAMKVAQRAPHGYPQGVEAGDEFWSYEDGPGAALVLQFRGGRLVNFRPSEFAGPGASDIGSSK
jgi:hypothetical protein